MNQLYNVKRVPVNAPLCNRVEESICTECPLHMLNSSLLIRGNVLAGIGKNVQRTHGCVLGTAKL